MPRIRIEWVPVQVFGLGLLGFDHLQLVYQQSDADSPRGQDAWFVMEGVREATGEGAFLGIQGADGRTTLSVANLAARGELVAKIGTPEFRGSRALPYGGDEFRAWETMASYAREIQDQDFPYIAYGLPGSPIPTINSSSAIASLIYYSGLDPSQRLPYGVHLSPGTATLLGTRDDDAMRIECGFSTLLGGHGRDAFVGGFDPHRIEKLYGGEDDDLFHWSTGFNIIHGGQPQLDYDADGTDVVDYSGAGTVTVTLNRHWVPHKVPNYVAVFANGIDHLFSIERIQWNETTDRIVLGAGIDLIEDDIVFQPSMRGPATDSTGPSRLRSGRLIDENHAGATNKAAADETLPEGARNLELVGTAVKGQGNDAANHLSGNAADNQLMGMAGDDTLYGGAGDDTLIGGPGSDGYVYLLGDGRDVILDSGPASDVDELVLAGGIGPQDVSFHRLAHAPDDLVLTLPEDGRIRIEDFLAGSGIERVVFDRAPAWTRDDLQGFAAAAPILDDAAAQTIDDRLVFRPELLGVLARAAHADPTLTVPLGDGVPPHGDAVVTHDDLGALAPAPWATLDAQAGWLF